MSHLLLCSFRTPSGTRWLLALPHLCWPSLSAVPPSLLAPGWVLTPHTSPCSASLTHQLLSLCKKPLFSVSLMSALLLSFYWSSLFPLPSHYYSTSSLPLWYTRYHQSWLPFTPLPPQDQTCASVWCPLHCCLVSSCSHCNALIFWPQKHSASSPAPTAVCGNLQSSSTFFCWIILPFWMEFFTIWIKVSHLLIIKLVQKLFEVCFNNKILFLQCYILGIYTKLFHMIMLLSPHIRGSSE